MELNTHKKGMKEKFLALKVKLEGIMFQGEILLQQLGHHQIHPLDIQLRLLLSKEEILCQLTHESLLQSSGLFMKGSHQLFIQGLHHFQWTGVVQVVMGLEHQISTTLMVIEILGHIQKKDTEDLPHTLRRKDIIPRPKTEQKAILVPMETIQKATWVILVKAREAEKFRLKQHIKQAIIKMNATK